MLKRPDTSSPDAPGQGTRLVALVQHRAATVTIRDDSLVAVRRGHKQLIGARTTLAAEPGQTLVVARGTQWDVVNDPAGQGRYESLVLAFGDEVVREHHQRHGPAAQGAVPDARRIAHDAELADAMQRAASFLQMNSVSMAVRRHRLLEVLLLLAERGHHFAPIDELGWDDKVRRRVAQRPHADWTVEALAESFHLSASTLRRRLDGCGVTLAALVREVRLEAALGLLQTTRLPVGEVAQRCGWESHSRFTAAFQARWGFLPSLLRGSAAPPAQRAAQDG